VQFSANPLPGLGGAFSSLGQRLIDSVWGERADNQLN
jgi:hypothetical protein